MMIGVCDGVGVFVGEGVVVGVGVGVNVAVAVGEGVGVGGSASFWTQMASSFRCTSESEIQQLAMVSGIATRHHLMVSLMFWPLISSSVSGVKPVTTS